MIKKRFRVTTNPKYLSVVFDEEQKDHYIGTDLEDLLNEQDREINILQQRVNILREEIQSTVYILKMQTRKLEGY